MPLADMGLGAYDVAGNYVKSANELTSHLDAGGFFTRPEFVNTASILDMNPIMPVSDGMNKDTNVLSNIIPKGWDTGTLTNIAIGAFAIGLAVKIFGGGKRR